MNKSLLIELLFAQIKSTTSDCILRNVLVSNFLLYSKVYTSLTKYF